MYRADVYGRFPTDGANCGIVSIRMEEMILKIDTCGGEATISGGCWRLLVGGPNYNTRMVTTDTGVVSGIALRWSS